MTREEARKCLIDISYALGNMSIEYLTEKDGEKMREAIKTLECEPCEDCVSREAASDAIFNIGMCTCSTKEVEVASKCLRAVEALPPVTPQPCTVTNAKEAEMFKQGQAESEG